MHAVAQGKAPKQDPPAQLATGSNTAEDEPSTSTEAAPATKKSSKTQRHRSKKAKACQKHLRQFMTSVTVDGETFGVGDSAYIAMTEDFDEDDFAEVEVCQVCGFVEPEDIPMVECDACLQGYHITCLNPPLPTVPKVMLVPASMC